MKLNPSGALHPYGLVVEPIGLLRSVVRPPRYFPLEVGVLLTVIAG
ncbi:hypothetical protein ACMGD3_11900 [Lysinibacillus sphaericus]